MPWADGAAAVFGALTHQVRQWALQEVAPGRLMPWLPVAFGLGIVLYFTAEREPAWWAAAAATLALATCAFAARNRPVGLPVMLCAAAIASGFAVATFYTLAIAHPILRQTTYSAAIGGFVEVREERERSDRIVVRVHTAQANRLHERLERVRVSVRKGTAPPVGAYVTFKARLNPPLGPLRPGGYDFARDLYFQRIGAIGFVLGRIATAQPPAPPHAWLRYAATVDAIREAIDNRIRAVVPGDHGAIASALITGKRDAISAPVNEAMYVSSLAHVLSISGYHMAVVAGVVFFTIRALLALIPLFASRRPIKKWAAFAAFVAAALYLLLSGAEVATQRSFIMTAIVLAGVMFDRQALTLRTLAVAALGVLLLAPQAVVHPSFQMSFAATLALIAAYRNGLPWMLAGAQTSAGARVALWGGREIVGLILASLVAGAATTLYAAYHFHRLAPYGVLANLLAMPIVSAWVMPAGLVGLLAMPFGFDAPAWRAMGLGIDWMIDVALWVASLPGAVGRVSAFGTGPLLLGTGGLLVLCMLKTPLRHAGAAMIAAACLWIALTPRPDILVAPDGRVVAVRGADRRLAIVAERVGRSGNDAFAVREWLAADADARKPDDASLREQVRCDDVGCIGRLADGTVVALSLEYEAFEDDCRRAAVVVTPRTGLPECGAMLIDRDFAKRHGAIALYRLGKGFALTTARPSGYDRPWAPATADSSAASTTRGRAVRPGLRDATPRIEDLEPGD